MNDRHFVLSHLLLLLEVLVDGVKPVLLGPGGAAPHPLVHVGDGGDGHLHRVIVGNLRGSHKLLVS